MIFKIKSAGIEFADREMRISVVQKSMKEIRYLGSETVPFVRDEDLSREDLDRQIVHTLKEAFQARRWKPRIVTFSIPRKYVITRTFEIPPVEKTNIRQILEFEIEKHIPFIPEEIYFDYYLPPGQDHEQLKVMLIAAQKEIVDRYMKILQDAGLTPNILLPTAGTLLEIYRAEELRLENQLVPAFLCDREGIEIAIFHRNTLKIVKYYEIDDPRWCEHFERNPSDEMSESLVDFLSTKIEMSVRQAILSLEVTTGFSATERVIYGRLHNLDQLKDTLASRGLEIMEPRSFLKTLTGVARDFKVDEYLPSLFLALRGIGNEEDSINILPEEMEVVKSEVGLYTAYTLAALIVLFGIAILSWKNIQLRSVHHELNTRIEELSREVDAVNTMKTELDQNKQLIDTFKDFNVGNPLHLDILKDLTEIIPDSIWLDNMRIRDEELQIRGYAENTAYLIQDLEHSQFLENVEEQHRRGSSRSRYKGDKTEGLIRFTITADIITEQ